MKKWMCIGLCLLLAFTGAACGGSAKKKDKDAGAIEKEAAEGRMTDFAFPLGTDPDTICAYFEERVPAEEEEPSDGDEQADEAAFAAEIDGDRADKTEFFDRTDGEDTVCLSSSHDTYFYEKGKKDGGVSVLLSYVGAYGFEQGVSMPSDVTARMKGEPTERDVNENDLFCLPELPENGKVLSYTVGSYRLDFLFVDDFLAVVALVDPALWSR